MTDALRQQIDQCQQDLNQARTTGDRQAEVRALARLGEAYIRLGGIEETQGYIHKAVCYYLDALDVAGSTSDPHSQLVALNNLIAAYREMGEPDKVLICADHKLTIAGAIHDRVLEVQAAVEVGRSALEMGDHRRAIGVLVRAIQIAKTDGLRPLEREALILLGMIHHKGGNPDMAAAVYRKALSGYDPERDRASEANLLRMLAEACQSIGKVDEAIRHMRRAAITYREIGQLEMQGRCLLALGEFQVDHGETTDARSSLEAARAVFIRLGLAAEMLRCIDVLDRSNGKPPDDHPERSDGTP